MHSNITKVTAWILLSSAAAATLGCKSDLVVTRIPEFYTPELTSIAVVPFRTGGMDAKVGEMMADRLANSLAANGAYRVANPSNLKAVLDQHDLSVAFGQDTAAASAKLRELTDVQAILIGTLTTYEATTRSEPGTRPIYGYDAQGNMYIQGYQKFTRVRNEGNVSATAMLIRVADGGTIYAMPAPASQTVWAEGENSAKLDPYGCREQAAQDVINQLVAAFAPVRIKIKVDRGKALRTATELYDGEWNYSDKFRPTDRDLFVVVALPPECDRNRFRIVIVRKDQREELASQEITWDKQYGGGYGYHFSPGQIAAKGGGKGKFEIKFYSGAEPVLRRDFQIVD